MTIPIKLRYQRVSDAKRFLEILSNPNFIYFSAKPSTVEEEKRFLRANTRKRREKTEFNHSIICRNKVIGAIGIRIDRFRSYIGEIGYFVDETYWNKGVATKAVSLLEKSAFASLGIKRIEILMDKRNAASRRVAVKSGYKKEGIARKKLLLAGKSHDCYVYAKTSE